MNSLEPFFGGGEGEQEGEKTDSCKDLQQILILYFVWPDLTSFLCWNIIVYVGNYVRKHNMCSVGEWACINCQWRSIIGIIELHIR